MMEILPRLKLGGPWLFLMWIAVSVPGSQTLCAQEIDDARADIKRIQGTWKLATLESDGQRRGPTPDEQGKLLVVQDKQMQFGETKFSYVIDPSTTPKLFDVTLQGENSQELLFEGIYRLQENKLDLCVFLETRDRKRPTDFVTKEGSKLIVLEFIRSE